MSEYPTTAAVRVLRAAGVEVIPHLYSYLPKGGAVHAAEACGVDPHAVVKTLVFQDDRKQPLVVLQHADRQVSAKGVARAAGVKKVAPCPPEVAERRSGYRVGGTSAFGLKSRIPVFMERSIADLDRVYINGGSRGFLVELAPAVILELLSPTLIDASQ